MLTNNQFFMRVSFSNQKQPLFFLLLALFTCTFSKAVAQNTVSNYRLYTVKDGLAANNIRALMLDSKGFLWVGTTEGINRFDGTSFSNFVDDATVATKAVISLAQVNDSTVLIGSALAGLFVFNLNNNRFQNFRITDSLLRAGSTIEVRSITALPKGQCLIMAGNYAFLLDKTLHVIRRKQTASYVKHAYSVTKLPAFLNKDSTRILLVWPQIKEFNLATFQERKLLGVFEPVNNPHSRTINALYKPSDSTLLYASWNEGLNYFDNGKGYCVSGTKELGQTRQICRDPLRNDIFWTVTEKGIGMFNEKTKAFSLFTLNNTKGKKELLNSCNDLVFDRHQNLWIGTEDGLVKVSATRNAFKEFPLSTDYYWLDIVDAVKEKSGTLWLSYWGHNLLNVDVNRKVVRHYHEQKDGTGRFSEDLFLAGDTLYAATSTGTFYYNEKKKRFLSPSFFIPDSLRKGGDKMVYRDSHHNWWIGFYGRGLYRFNTNNKKANFYTLFRPPSSSEYLEMLYATTAAEDRWGNIWMGRASHSATFTKWDWRTEKFTVIPVRTKNLALRNFAIYGIVIDENDDAWIAAPDYGVLQYNIRTGQWTQYDKTKGLKSNQVPSLAIDKEGNVWAGTSNGLSVLYKGQSRFVTFTEDDGLPFEQIVWAGFPDKRNTDSLLIAGINKMAWVSLPQLKRPSDTPRVLIQSVYLNNEPLFEPGKHSFHHTESNFRFLFTSVNLQNGDNVYAYRLKGAGKDWIEISKQHEVSFNNLAAGHYVFELKARNSEGIWSSVTSWAFTIQQPYYQRWWFYILLTVTTAAIGYSLYRYRLNKIKALYNIRSRISRDLHDEVGSTLSSISIMNEMAKARANGNAALNEKIADNLQRVQSSMQDIVWAVNPKNDDLEHLLLRFSEVAQEMLEPKGIAYHFTVPEDIEGLKLSMEQRREIYLIYKECLNNILKYSACTEVNIKFSVKGQTLDLLLSDNGKGFDPSHGHSGNGLRNMKERAKDMNGTLTIQSDEGRGTVIDLKVPLA